MIILTALLTVLVTIIIYWRYNIYVQRKKLRWMLGEPGLPIFGLLFEFRRNTEICQAIEKYTRKNNGLCWIDILSWTRILVTNYKFAEYILTSNTILNKSKVYNFIKIWLGTGLLTAPGTKWKTMRKILTPAFHFSILEQFIPIFESNSDTLINLLHEESKKGIVDVSPFITMLTLDNISESAMGVKINAQMDPQSEYVKAVKGVCNIAVKRMKNLFARIELVYPLFQMYYDEKKYVKFLHGYTDKIITMRKKEATDEIGEIETDDSGRRKKVAFLDLLLKTSLNGQPLSDEEISDEVNTFMFAGHDTTAAAISAVIYCLAYHPEIQEKVVDEQKQIFEDDIRRSSTYTDLQAMKYLEKVIKEALRLYPSVPTVGRMSDKDIEYEDGKIIPAGVEILVCIHAINRNSDIFPNPESFNPERFESSTIISPFSYLPFSAGPRNCIGQKFALLEIKATTSKLLRNFEISSPGPGYEPIYTSEVVYYSMNGINVLLKERKLFK